MEVTEPLWDSRAIAGDAAAIAERAEADGYVYLSGCVAADRVAAARDRVRAACDRAGLFVEGAGAVDFRDPRYVAVQAEVLPSKELRGLGSDPGLIKLVECVMGGPVAPRGGDVCRIVAPRAKQLTTPPHQDAYYLRVAPPIWIAWIPLADCSIEAGPLAVWAGSHKAGLRQHHSDGSGAFAVAVDGTERWCASGLRAGDVILFDARVVQRALENRSQEYRLSVDFRFGLLRG